jgi:Rps23 Pro-64 3,4-dihydroxylase Tpa1-like proline 4-hydroxylase
VQCGSHDENIQIGWLRLPNVISELDDIHSEAEFEPIFLDSWVKEPILKDESTEDDNESDEDDGLKWRSMSALYRVKRGLSDSGLNSNSLTKPESQKHNCYYYQQHQHRYSQRQYLSQPFGPDSPSWPSEINLEPSEFVKVLASQLSNEDLRSRFIGTETIHDPDIKVVDVVPRGGTLVLFDSVAVPHEVLEVMSGDRLAIAGWFHELQQPFPNWYGT